MSFGSNIWGFIEYPAPNYTGVLNEEKMGDYLDSLFLQMKTAGQNSIYLSFAQLDNIEAYSSSNFETPRIDISYDVVTALLNSLQKNNVSVPNYPNFLNYLIAEAHQSSMKIVLAFGGGVATDTSFKVLQQADQTYTGQAELLATFIKSYDLDGVDFDIEDPTALSSQKADSKGGTILDFFQTLRSQLDSSKTTSLTTMLGQEWQETFSDLLTHFNLYFDGLNLMAYSDSQFWLDADTPEGAPNQGWTIKEWIDAIGKENAAMIHVGFDDGVPYASPSANAGQCTYTLQPSSTNGQAAAQIYQQLLTKLSQDGYSALGDPFYWPAADVKPDGADRYKPTISGGSNFVSTDMQDFYDWLSAHAILWKFLRKFLRLFFFFFRSVFK